MRRRGTKRTSTKMTREEPCRESSARTADPRSRILRAEESELVSTLVEGRKAACCRRARHLDLRLITSTASKKESSCQQRRSSELRTLQSCAAAARCIRAVVLSSVARHALLVLHDVPGRPCGETPAMRALIIIMAVFMDS